MIQATAQASNRFLAIGDSYTIGEGVAAPMRWPNQLVARLRSETRALADPEIVATTGWTTDELLQGLAALPPLPPYAMVSLLIGVNNQYRGGDLDIYRDEFAHLLDLASAWAGHSAGRVLVVSIPDWGVTPFATDKGVEAASVAAAIDRFNAVARGLVQTAGAHWVDVTDVSRGVARAMLTDDGLHPSAAQYSAWVERILPAARRILDATDRDEPGTAI
jgi:lysophospholipase L1-like esterase